MMKESDPPQADQACSDGVSRQSLDTFAPSDGDQAWQAYAADDSVNANDHGSLEGFSHAISLIWFRKRLVGVVMLVFTAMACLYAYSQERIFESCAEVNLLPAVRALSTAEGTRAGSRDASYVTAEMRFLRSSRLISRFIDTLQVSDSLRIPVNHQSLSELLSHIPGTDSVMQSSVVLGLFPHSTGRPTLDRAPAGDADSRTVEAEALDYKALTGAFRSALRVKLPRGLGRDNGIVEVRLRSNWPEAAHRTLQAYLDFYGKVIGDQLRTDLEAQRSVLKAQLAQAEERLLQSQTILAEFEHENGVVLGSDNAVAPILDLVNKSVERILEVREEKERIRSMPHPYAGLRATALGKTDEQGFLADLKQQLATLETKYAEWGAVYSADFPKMVRLQKQINYLRQKVGSITQKAADAALASAIREERVREHTLDETRRDAERMNSLQNRYAALRKKVESNSKLCQRFLNALVDLDIKSGTTQAGVAIIEPPTLPSVPVAPRRGLIIAIGIALGLLCGVGVASATEHMASSSKVLDIEKIAAEIKARPLGIVPDFGTLENTVRKPKNGDGLPLDSSDPSRHAFTHVMRDIEASLFFLHSGERPKTTIVSSAISREGKTFFAVSLSCAMSVREGQKTLVVDADMRKPRLHKVFGHKEPGPGLSTVLTDRNAVLSQVIHHSRFPGLCYLTAGSVPADPLALLRSRRFRELLGILERSFNNIVIDSPPILSVPDYMPLGHLGQGVILVVRQGETLREEVRKSAELIRSVPGAYILGLVLNRAQMTAGRYSSFGPRPSRYHYRYHERYCRKVS